MYKGFYGEKSRQYNTSQSSGSWLCNYQLCFCPERMSKAWQIKPLPWSGPALLYITLCGEVTSAQEDDSVVVIDAHQIASSCATIQHALLLFFLGHSCTDKGLGKYCTMNDKHRASTALLRLTICLNTQCLSSSTFGFNGRPSIFNCHSRHPHPFLRSPCTAQNPWKAVTVLLCSPQTTPLPLRPPIHTPFVWQACLYKLGKNRERERQREKWESGGEGLSFSSSNHSCSSVNSAIP